jgi:hypothetical protein
LICLFRVEKYVFDRQFISPKIVVEEASSQAAYRCSWHLTQHTPPFEEVTEGEGNSAARKGKEGRGQEGRAKNRRVKDGARR